jgi:hypothetical protein
MNRVTMAKEFHGVFPAVVKQILAGMGQPTVKQAQARRVLSALEDEQAVISF